MTDGGGEAGEDLAWVRAVAGGDRAALGRLYDRHAPQLFGIALKMLKEAREAEDLVQDVFVEVWRSARGYDPARGTVALWLRLRLRSRAVDRIRSARRARVVSWDEVPAVEPIASDDPSLAPDQRRVRQALGELPGEQREVLELAYFGGLSSSEIAERAQIPIGTVKSRTAAALARLRKSMGAGS